MNTLGQIMNINTMNTNGLTTGNNCSVLAAGTPVAKMAIMIYKDSGAEVLNKYLVKTRIPVHSHMYAGCLTSYHVETLRTLDNCMTGTLNAVLTSYYTPSILTNEKPDELTAVEKLNSALETIKDLRTTILPEKINALNEVVSRYYKDNDMTAIRYLSAIDEMESIARKFIDEALSFYPSTKTDSVFNL